MMRLFLEYAVSVTWFDLAKLTDPKRLAADEGIDMVSTRHSSD